MIHIVLCDDDGCMLNQMEKEISLIRDQEEDELDVLQYKNPSMLLEDLGDNDIHCDILITDIDMPEMDGMELAEQVKRINSDMLLLFITAHNEMVYSSIEHGPFRFIRKEFMEKELGMAVKAACKSVRTTRNERFVIKTGEVLQYIETKDILYADMEKRRTSIHQTNGEVISIWIPLNKIEKELQNLTDDFVRINKGTIVNRQHIKRFGNSEIVLDTGYILPVSRSMKKKVREEIMRYWSINL